MNTFKRIGLITFVLFVLIKNISAEMYYTSEVLIGEKATGLGGAFSALADDPGACFYNPAGLTLSKQPYLSVSAQAAEYNEQIGKFLISNDEKFYSLELVPSFTGISRDFGKGRLGLSIALPYYSAFELHQTYDNQKIGFFDTTTIILDMKTSDKTYLIGPSYAIDINDEFSIGATIYLNYKVLKDQNNRLIDAKGVGVSWFQRTENVTEGTGNGFSGIFGLLYKKSDQLNLSCVLKSGDIANNTINYNGLTTRLTTIADSTAPPVISRSNETIKNKFLMPPSITLGLAYKIKSNFLIVYDLSYFAPVAYDVDKFSFNSKSNEYIKKTDRIIKKNIFNHNVGTEYMITESVPLRFGFYTNYSLSPDVYLPDYNSSIDKQKYTDQYGEQSHIDKYGITLSSGMISENSTLTISLKYGFGKGQRVSGNLNDTAGTQPLEVQDLKFANYALGFSGSYWF